MPASIHSDISVDAVGEALLQHYNVGIRNPWFDIGRSDQETYNRKKLPWAGKRYSVDGNTVSGPNADSLPDGLTQQWQDFASEVQSVHAGNNYDGLEDMYQTLVTMSP